MNLMFNLPDPKRCEGCPCIGVQNWGVGLGKCNLGYRDDPTEALCIDISERPRPAKCIEEHGA